MEAHRNAPGIGDAVYDAAMSIESTDIAAMQGPMRQRTLESH